MTMKRLWAFALFPFLLIPAAAQNCDQLMKDSKPDAESVRRAEREWSKAFLTGDTDYLECLLEPDYESVWYTGQVRSRQEIIDKAALIARIRFQFRRCPCRRYRSMGRLQSPGQTSIFRTRRRRNRERFVFSTHSVITTDVGMFSVLRTSSSRPNEK